MTLYAPPDTPIDGLSGFRIRVPELGKVTLQVHCGSTGVSATMEMKTARELLGQLARAISAARGNEVVVDREAAS